MTLTHNPKSGYIKRDGAVIGRVVQVAGGAYRATLFTDQYEFHNAVLPELLKAVRDHLVPPLPPATKPRKVAARKRKDSCDPA